MKFLRPFLAITLLLTIVAIGLLWWNAPHKVDMADYVPGDALVYLEVNSLADVTRVVEQNDTWKAAAQVLGTQTAPENRWLSLAARLGLAPINGVIFSRSQIALAVIGMNTVEQGETLHVRPEAAVIIETHTAHWRVKPAAVAAVKQLALFAYGQSICNERTDNADFVECSSPAGDRKLLAAIDGSLVVIGNTENAVRACLEVRRGTRPSLRTDSELVRVRASLGGDRSLSFGYISSANAARLFSWAAPLLMGRGPGDRQLEQVLAASAAKILRGIAWTTSSASGGIEDRFLFSLDPEVITRLEPAFNDAASDEGFWKFLPETVQSVTIYRSRDPVGAWAALDSAVALKLDAVSSVVFASLLKSGLSIYGIEDPKEVFSALTPPLLTVKPASGVTGSVLLARVANHDALHKILAQQIAKTGNGQILDGIQSDPKEDKEFTAVFSDGYLLVGKTENIRPCLVALRSGQVLTDEMKSRRVGHFATGRSAPIVTYANDESRVSSFIDAVALMRGLRPTRDQQDALQKVIGGSSFSATVTTLSSTGIERNTRSAFGQFSTLLSFLQPDTSSSSTP